jgi:formate dehydrogenase (coenzyme F420) beta subunit
MENRELEQKLRKEAATLLEEGKVDYIVGYEEGSLKFTTSPLITRDSSEVSRLVINPFIVNNLANFLTGLKGKVGIVAKGCDSRSIVSLIQDNKISRDNVVILGVPCPGLIDLGKVERLMEKDRDELDDITRDGDSVVVKVGDKSSKFSLGQVLFDSCLECELPTPQEYDLLLGEAVAPLNEKEAGRGKIAELKSMAPKDRWEFWKGEFANCIRCYACRNVCPACFCNRCFVEESTPQWIQPAPKWQDNLIFQVVRNIHVAGRCVDCGACERACPVNIPLRSLSKEMYDIVGELFHFKPGMDKDAEPLMTHYEQEEAEDLIR